MLNWINKFVTYVQMDEVMNERRRENDCYEGEEVNVKGSWIVPMLF